MWGGGGWFNEAFEEKIEKVEKKRREWRQIEVSWAKGKILGFLSYDIENSLKYVNEK